MRGVHQRFSWDALNVTKDASRVWWDEVLLPIAAGRAWGRGLACRTFARSFTFSWSSQSGAELGRLPRSCERTLEWIIC